MSSLTERLAAAGHGKLDCGNSSLIFRTREDYTSLGLDLHMAWRGTAQSRRRSIQLHFHARRIRLAGNDSMVRRKLADTTVTGEVLVF